MNIEYFKFIEALICDARWHEVTSGKSDEQRLEVVNEMWLRWNSYKDSNLIDKMSLIEYLNYSIYFDH